MQGSQPRPLKKLPTVFPGIQQCVRGLLLFLGIFLLLGSPLHADSQYSAPGTLDPTQDIPAQEDMEELYTAAGWPLGALRFAPWVGVRDAASVRGDAAATGFEKNDFTLSIGAGLRGYLRTGKSYLAFHLLPEYVWWEENEEKRRTNGRFGVGWFGYFNRLRVELSARRLEEQGFFSAEVQELTSSRRDVLRAAIEVDLGSRFFLFGRARYEDFENDEENTLFSLLDREEETLLLGVRYHTPSDLILGLGYEVLSTDLAPGTFNRSNSGDALYLEISQDGNRLAYRLAFADKTLDPEVGSQFRGFDDLTGNLEVLARFSRRLNLLTYARRDLYYSLRPDTSHYLGERFGARVGLEGRRLSVGVFAEVGEDDYEAILESAPDRIDDQSALGVDLTFQLRDTIGLVVSATRTEYDSNFDVFDRDITTLGLQLELGSLFRKLSIGNPPGDW